VLAYKIDEGILIKAEEGFYKIDENWDHFINNDNIHAHLIARINESQPVSYNPNELSKQLCPPIGSQEIWASGVTYYRSREARIDESKDAGGGDFYERVYNAERPELFFKCPSYRVRGDGDMVRIRKDSKWNVPEPELTLVITSSGKIIGYTIGNDMSSRDIEGENPLYLPQAKTYDGSASIGPGVWITNDPFPEESKIQLEIYRNNNCVFQGNTSVSQMKRKLTELIEYLYRETSFGHGCYLMTGTGIVPPDSFTLFRGDDIHITIDNIGTLKNTVE